MWAIFLAGGKRFAGWIVAALSFLAMLVTVWHTSRKVGKAEAEAEYAKQHAAESEQRAAEAIETVQKVNAVETAKVDTANETLNSINVLPDGAAAKQLHDKWSRD